MRVYNIINPLVNALIPTYISYSITNSALVDLVHISFHIKLHFIYCFNGTLITIPGRVDNCITY